MLLLHKEFSLLSQSQCEPSPLCHHQIGNSQRPKNCSFLSRNRWRIHSGNKSRCFLSLICMPPLLKEDAAWYFIIKEASSSQHGISLHLPNSQLCFFFLLFNETLLNIHKQQTKHGSRQYRQQKNELLLLSNEPAKDKLEMLP